MNLRSFLSSVVLLFLSIISFSFAELAPTGPFGPPYNENQSWSACTSTGWSPYGDPDSHQYHMQLNEDLSTPKYHMGEDLNGICGGNSDEGAPLLAIAGGQVVFLDKVGTVSGQGKRLYIRHSIPYAFASGDVMTFDIAMLHLQSISSDITWSGSGTGSDVKKGETVAYLGKTGTKFAHLHWEAQVDLTIPLGTNPYKKPLPIKHALKYRAPSMIVDDRRDLKGYRVPDSDSWYSFTMQGNAPSSTAYIMHNGQRKSLKKAIAAGWIPSQGILHERDGTWYYYGDVDANFFNDGERYAIKTLVSGPVHYIPVPRNNFQEDRARLDMLHAVENDSRFVNVQVETFGSQTPWNSNSAWNLYWMWFELSDGRISYANQVTNRLYPLLRCTAYYDPDTSRWTDWDCIDKNRLY